MLWQTIAEICVWIALVVLLAIIFLDDLKNYRILNRNILMLAGLFIGWCQISSDMMLLVNHLSFAFVIFIVLCILYHFGMMGGGDVKLLTVAFLWIGMEYSLLFCVMLGLASLAYIAIARFNWAPSRKSDKRVSVPFGPSIAAAWIATVLIAEIPRLLR